MSIEVLGYIGGLCFAFSALPQTIKTLRTGKADDLSWGLLLMWLVGEIAMIIYERVAIHSLPLFLNYSLNLCFLLPILYVKAKPLGLKFFSKRSITL
jgi:MtN3 and saliva related transmembrane protein